MDGEDARNPSSTSKDARRLQAIYLRRRISDYAWFTSWCTLFTSWCMIFFFFNFLIFFQNREQFSNSHIFSISLTFLKFMIVFSSDFQILGITERAGSQH
jgi:hypothetical protein